MIEVLTLTGEVQGALLSPATPNGWGVIVITGSSGRVDVDRATLFAERGATVLAQKWWGGEGQAQGICLIPIEVFIKGIDFLVAQGCTRIAMLGTSNGAQATLLTAARDPRVEVAVAISPTLYVWQNFGPGLDGQEWPPRSAFTWGGEALPCLVYDPRAWPRLDRPRPIFRPLYEASLRAFAEDIPAATIPVEQVGADIILVAGAADALWPSDTAARDIAARLTAVGRAPMLVEHPDAGHSPVFPGEAAPAEPMARAWGGTREADRELGAMAWEAVRTRLGLAA